MFWVPSGVAAIYAIRNAGLAVAQGTWSSLIVMVSFSWGIFIFREGMKSVGGAIIGAFLMCCGLWGMSYYSSPNDYTEVSDVYTNSDYTSTQDNDSDDDVWSDDVYGIQVSVNDGFCIDGEGDHDNIAISEEKRDASRAITEMKQSPDVYCCGRFISRRKLGLAAAFFNGVWGGSVLVPMHFAGDTTTSGLGYVISFAVGATIITIFLWILRLLCSLPFHDFSFSSAVASLPSFHVRVLWKAGAISGMLWSLGNICSMISVTFLGEGVGYSVVQASMLVSGLWGIFWFQEVTGWKRRIQWFLMAGLTLMGILVLGYEHMGQ